MASVQGRDRNLCNEALPSQPSSSSLVQNLIDFDVTMKIIRPHRQSNQWEEEK